MVRKGSSCVFGVSFCFLPRLSDAVSEGTQDLGEGCSLMSAGIGLGGLWLDSFPWAGAVTLAGISPEAGK